MSGADEAGCRKLPAIFSPMPNDASEAPRHGKRRVTEIKPAVVLRWPKTMTERRKVFRWWRWVAMRILRREKLHCRVVAIFDDALIWNTGEIHKTTDWLSDRSGGWGEKTVRRELEAYAAAGIIIIENGWRRVQSHLRRTRVIRLSIPAEYDGPMPPDELDFDDGPSGPRVTTSEEPETGEPSGPRVTTSSGPRVTEHTSNADTAPTWRSGDAV
ncbi:hypothetical protein [Consotaella aegiceratis]|uniref:hypothetical protein n=1 Tax=Consotaella aegiceratis TaxID=3097961 RepID=UPI002F3FE243